MESEQMESESKLIRKEGVKRPDNKREHIKNIH